jgi:hypothetical protein
MSEIRKENDTNKKRHGLLCLFLFFRSRHVNPRGKKKVAVVVIYFRLLRLLLAWQQLRQQ